MGGAGEHWDSWRYVADVDKLHPLGVTFQAHVTKRWFTHGSGAATPVGGGGASVAAVAGAVDRVEYPSEEDEEE
jgi:hypothetical protein